jgi:predicted dehydrogenase
MGRTIGVIGCGRWGSLIVRDLVSLGASVHVVSPSAASRRQGLDLGAAKAHASIAELPAVDGVVVAVPSSLHAQVIESVLDRRVPIFVEKPLTTDPESADRLVHLAGERIFVMDKWRYLAGVRRLGELARSGRLGEVRAIHTTRLDWGNPHDDVDSVWILAPHDLSIALEILGEVPTPVFAMAHGVGRLIDLTAVLRAGTVTHHLRVSARSDRTERRIEVHGTAASAVLAGGWEEQVTVYQPAGDLTMTSEIVPTPGELPLLGELRAFLAHLDGGPAPVTRAADGARIVAVIAEMRAMAGLL